ncbi:MAG: HipA domain-containing protein [Bacteroidales bacterium]|nr:HipA domain-containing protein [Bacteroidales bacterium]MBQ9194300.1 HipA domain-containing protein [Bacteroidales bacterium]
MIEIKNYTYSPKVLGMLFGGKKVSPFLDFSIDGLKKSEAAVEAAGLISVSGVQEKFPAVIDNGIIRLAREGERSTHILKPAQWDETIATRRHIPANEHLTMQIASQVYGIATADNGLCFSKDGQVVYITRRFDILPDGSKLPMEDFASVLGRRESEEGKNFKYSGYYEDIADGIRRNVSAWMVDMERFFDLVVFNYIYGNGDDHLKNFSLIRIGEDYRLAPAYDLINTCLHVAGDDFGLDGGLSRNIFRSDVYGKTGHPCRTDFERFGELIGLRSKRIEKILHRYAGLPELTETLVTRSFLPEKYKRMYLRIVKERLARFSRVSE